VGDWDVYLTSEVAAWLDNLQATDAKTADLVDDAIYALSHRLGDQELKGTTPGSSGTGEVRILFVSTSGAQRSCWPGTNPGKWDRWYAKAIPRAEQLYEIYLKERAEEESGR
jgi:hypothetical protein